jgi:hypothetical protein
MANTAEMLHYRINPTMQKSFTAEYILGWKTWPSTAEILHCRIYLPLQKIASSEIYILCRNPPMQNTGCG